MNPRIRELLAQIERLEEELKEELRQEERKVVGYRIVGRRIYFDPESLRRQKEALVGAMAYLLRAPFPYVLSAPIIYAMIIPAVIMDLFVTIYHAINFRIYGIPRVKRSDYIVFDRHYLGYLNWIEKLNCLYCSYFNGLMGYVGEIAARTEQFWCPIKHAKKIAYRHSHYNRFLPYGEAEAFRRQRAALRDALKKEQEKRE